MLQAWSAPLTLWLITGCVYPERLPENASISSFQQGSSAEGSEQGHTKNFELSSAGRRHDPQTNPSFNFDFPVIIAKVMPRIYKNPEFPDVKNICEQAGIECHLISVPEIAVFATQETFAAVRMNYENAIPGIGFHQTWFHCVAGMSSNHSTRQTFLFTNPYSSCEDGLSFMCHPRRYDIVQAINYGLRKVNGCDDLPNHEGQSGNMHEGDPQEADIVFGVDEDWSPWSFYDDGILKGFDPELIPMVCTAAKLKCATVTVPFMVTTLAAPEDYPKNLMQTGQMVLPTQGYTNHWFHCTSGQAITKHRAKVFAFSDPYTESDGDSNMAAFYKDARQTSLLDVSDADFPIQGKRVAVVKGSAAYLHLKEEFETKYNLTVKGFDTINSVAAALLAGKVDLLYSNVAEVRRARWFTQLDEIGPRVQVFMGYGFMCERGRYDIVQKLNVGLRAVKVSDQFKKACRSHSIPCEYHGKTFDDNNWPLEPWASCPTGMKSPSLAARASLAIFLLVFGLHCSSS